MKTLRNLTLLTLLGAFISCSNTESGSGYEISLNVTGASDSTLVSLYKRTDEGQEVVDSVWLLNGQASFTGTFDQQPERYNIKFDGQRGSIALFLENGNINITAHIDSLRKAKVSGSFINDKYAILTGKQGQVRKKMEPLYPAYMKAKEEKNKAKQDEIDSLYEVYQAEYDDITKEFIKANRDNILGPYLASRIYYYDDYLAELDSTVKTFDPALNGSKYLTLLQNQLAAWNKLKIGMVVPDFSQADSLGQQLSISSLRGKYILIDFWASWCGPCRQENPNIVAAYKKYNEKGFDILGVSLDENRDKWLKAIDKDELTWHHVSDLKGWKNEVSSGFGIKAIPYSMLIDPDGMIIGKNLRGEKLHEALADALN